MMQFRGAGHIESADEIRNKVYDSSPEPERNADKEKKGLALIVDLERVDGFMPGVRIAMRKSRNFNDTSNERAGESAGPFRIPVERGISAAAIKAVFAAFHPFGKPSISLTYQRPAIRHGELESNSQQKSGS
jgi:hypothetical protein